MRGRDREWRHVEGLLRKLRRGGGGTLLVDGEPGSGKSLLLAEAVAEASGRGIGVVHGRVEELGELAPCGMLLEALGLRPEPGGGDGSARSGPPVLERLRSGFERLATVPVLAAFDDLQRADPATLRMVHVLHDLLAGRPISWLMFRSTAPNTCQAVSLFDILEREGADRVTLAPLSPAAVVALTEDTLGRASDPATRALAVRTGGNPLLITELFAGLRDEGLLRDAARAGAPGRLRIVVRGWIDTLSTEARSLVVTIAVLGRSLSLEHAASLLDTTPAALLPVTEEATAAGILIVTEHGLVFRHELVADIVVAGTPPSVRQALLDQSGVLMGSERVGPARVLTGPASVAIDAAIASGRLHEAEKMVRSGLAQHGSVYGSAELRCLLADTMYLTGRGDEAIHEAETVLAVRGLPGHVRERATLVRLYATALLRDDGTARAYAQEIIDGKDRYGHAARSAALVALATAERHEGRLSGALALAESAGRPAGAGSPEEHRYEACLIAAGVLVDVHRLDEARAMLRQARKDMFGHGHLAWAADASALEARLELLAGRFDEAVTEARRALDLAGALNTPLSAAAACAVLAAVALRRGDLRGAAHHLGEQPGGAAEARLRHALLAAQVTEARDGPRSAMSLLAGLPRPLLLTLEPAAGPWMARVALGAGDRAAAGSVVAAAEALGGANQEFPALGAAAAHARGLLDRDGDALALAAGRAEDVWARASAEEDLGKVLAGAGRRVEAAESLERALHTYDEIGSVRDAARIRRTLRGMGVRHRHWSYAERPVSGWDSLTETEHAVSLLAADGRTNPQIAEQMFISVHTVAFHLKQVFRKLSIRSRVELARLAAERTREGFDPPRGGGHA
ncbi:LuxR C-terminal-related transcriptional regulator [Actinomadura sp. ATCC 31491]|uniref:LuxR C-terminal-related transcriptional regulator n=1 Tax=Actinomadura luzonensis TaxID=2805427 RepID=A0ABT0G0L9_9ACTN|nr:LuxR family transcriptional regulator [Actinomadura luzonensis]MCK2218150.1 LuxR C-terminal-related transcriptional regulator [Actinomadura luzonensis]